MGGTDEEEPMPENKSSSECKYYGPTHNDVRCLICKALSEQKNS